MMCRQISKLSKNSYDKWNIQVKMLLESLELWDVVCSGYDEIAKEELERLNAKKIRHFKVHLSNMRYEFVSLYMDDAENIDDYFS